MNIIISLSAFALLAAVVLAAPPMIMNEPRVALTVSYCPTVFSGSGAVISVDPHTGNFTVEAKGWSWPDSGSWGCPENQDPDVLVDTDSVWLQFTSDWGFTTEVSMKTGKVEKSFKGKTKELEFDGFTAFTRKGFNFHGITPGVTEEGFCDDGCFQYGKQSTVTGEFVGEEYVPFKAAMTNVAHVDEDNNIFYTQCSYPLNDTVKCSNNDTDQCLVALDATTGAFLSSKLMNKVEIYSWAPHPDKDGSMLAWVFGFMDVCKHPYNDFAFARVHPANATAELIACIPHNVTVDMDENIAAFTQDGTLFATGSGNAETGHVQILVLEPSTGALALQTNLTGIKEALGVSTDAPFVNVWAVNWMN